MLWVVEVEQKNKDLFHKAVYVAFLLFLIYLILELARKILGGSLGFEELVIGLLIANLGYSFYLRESVTRIDTKISAHMGWHKGRDGRKT